ncbi:MAG: phosphodiester glycosidase family protein [Sedimentibacter sp.]|uniref:phosphodiester glycosidase family protein n=1 Tax=Sedimentibacter sp. TaxID=1960295 RepID=UPI0029813B5C|nr:phosphodiester glycosidase family protein [Sedimentibacter sp.]MDW5300139.1 phosphodiester glycosidase family protein [Sedimentibacter sp.]
MIIKKIAAFSAAIALMLSVSAYANSLYTVYDLSEETRLSTGITYEKTEKYTSSGWMNINVIRVDLNDEYTEVNPIKNEGGVSNRTPLSSMIKSSGAVAAVNGDFFYMGDPTYTYGALIADGNLITSPLPYSDGYPTVSRLLDGTVNISVWNPKITLYGSDSTEFNVIVMNKTSSLDWGPTILTTDWNKTSPGYTNKDIVEVVVVDGTVSEIRKNQPSTIIPVNGYVIASSNATTMNQMLSSFMVGQPVSLNIELDYSPEDVDWAFGALNYLVKDGQLNNVSSQALGTNPRTAIGYNKDNSEMIMVTIDGRNKNYVGVKQTELAQIMLELGAYNAVNMDGGGSTTMGVDFLKNSNVTVVNIPSDGKERKIASGVGVFNTSPESNTVNTVEIASNNNVVFNNTEVALNLKFFNEFYTPLIINTNDVNFTVSPSYAGKVVNNVFYPSKTGKAVITASVGSAEGKAEIEVLETPVALNFSTDTLTLGFGDTYNLGDALGIDKDGKSGAIPAKYITFSYRNRVGKVENGIFTAGETSNTGAITATFGDAVKHIQVKVGYRYKTLFRFEDLENLKLNLYPEVSDGKISISKDFVKEGSNALKLDYDFTKMTDQSIAFVEFGNNGEGIKLEDKPEAIGMWIYGDEKNHWLRTRITDAYGNQVKLTFEDEVNFNGWKWVEAAIPEETAYPITLNNIYLAEINETRKDAGTIYIDNLRILYEPKDKELGLRAETQFVDSIKTMRVSDYLEKLIVTSSKGKIVTSDEKNNGSIIYFDGIISNGTMNADNTTMWNNIKSMAGFEDKVLVLSLNSDLDHINDQREVKILKKILEKASENNQVFVVYKGSKENTIVENEIRYITYDDSFELGVTDEGTAYKN